MAKSKLEMRLYEFSPAIERLMAEIEAHTDEDGAWIGTVDQVDKETGEVTQVKGRDFEEIVQDVMNMEKDKKEKVLGIGHLILHLKECMERHEAHAARHAKRAKSFSNNIDRLKGYIKGNTSETDKFKDDFVSIYPLITKIAIPAVTTEKLPLEYRRPTLVASSSIDRTVVERLHIACAKQNIPSPFQWEIDKAKLKADIIEAEKAGWDHPWGGLETNRSVVVR